MSVISTLFTTLLIFDSQFFTVQSVTDLHREQEEHPKQIFNTKSGVLETTYLGSYNSRWYFLGHGPETQVYAKENCRSAGMQLVTFTGPQDLLFVQDRLNRITNATYYYFWTDGTNSAANSCFSSGGQPLSNSFRVSDYYAAGLLFPKRPGDLTFIQSAFNFLPFPYVCIA